MNEINSNFYRLADTHGHKIVYFDLPETKSMSLEDDKGCYIGLDPSLTGKELRTRLAHELGHCEYGGFYNAKSPLDLRGKREYKADVWAVQKVLPFEELRKAILDGIREKWELAEYFGVPEDFISFALTYYLERKGYTIDVPDA